VAIWHALLLIDCLAPLFRPNLRLKTVVLNLDLSIKQTEVDIGRVGRVTIGPDGVTSLRSDNYINLLVCLPNQVF
jgi:hypothetical protein